MAGMRKPLKYLGGLSKLMDMKSVAKKYGIPGDIKGTCSMENIENGKVSFLADINYKCFLKPNQGITVLTSQKNYEKIKSIEGNTYIIVENPHHAFIDIHNAFHADFVPFSTGNGKPSTGKNCEIDSTAKFGSDVEIGDNVRIFPNVVVGSNVRIGDNTKIFSCSSIYDNVKIGGNCVIDANAAIGGEGFSTACSKENGAMRLINVGGVEIGNDVEIGNNSAVDRASFLSTRIGDRVKIDNLVHIGHNVQVGEDTRIAASSCIGGSCRIGKRVWIGIGCTVRDHVSIGDDCEVLINSVLVSSIQNGTRVAGYYAVPNSSWLAFMKDIHKKYILKG